MADSEEKLPDASSDQEPENQSDAAEDDAAADDAADDDAGFPDPTDDVEMAPASDEAAEMDAALLASLFEEMSRLKDNGNTHFKAGANDEACKIYAEAIKQADLATSDKAKTEIKPLLISLNNNSAAARLKLEHWDEVIERATAVLELEAGNSKALFRRGVARSKLGQLSSAHDDLLTACKSDPKNREARTELASVQAALKAQKEAERSAFSAKFGSAAEKAVAKEEAQEAARKREAERQKELAEAKLREEWKDDCVRLRAKQKAQREETRRARLKRFLGEDADEPLADGAAKGEAASDAAGGSAAEQAAARAAERVAAKSAADQRCTDISDWARTELASRLKAVRVEDGDVAATVTQVRALEGSTSLVSKAEGGELLPFFEYGFTIDWKMGGAPGGSASPSSAGTLSYTEVVAGADGRSVSIGDVSHTVDETEPVKQVETEGDKGGEEGGEEGVEDGEVAAGKQQGAMPIERSLQVLELLKTVVSDALDAFHTAVATEGAASAAAAASAASSGPVIEEMEEEDPIGFEEWKKQKEEEEKAEKTRREEMERKARDEREAERRRARKAEKVVVGKEEGLSEMRGYKIRADGSKTSYFDRQVDAETKALLDKQKQPKRLSVGAEGVAESAPSAAAGSAWNVGGTWEEKDMGSWAKDELTSRLEGVRTSADDLTVKVSKSKSVEGTASVVASRGTMRHLYEFSAELEFSVKDASAVKVCAGTLKYEDISPTPVDGHDGAVHLSWKTAPKSEDAARADAAVAALKQAVTAELASFDAHFKSTKRI
uniref:Activator of Hsp90 ATPase AHSA1-like N-terminal domain-containing protein n=1 Tax=Haptolina brevifila TaxID=156173 RepID=A0A7S2DGV5_9EUKA|mmetsp:Transcript_37165/g.74262  ORF Transcript_37165/g.74262 Transcript_37165/m.74262 type:complete len:781 (+) Transcript_37165:122-2464(+)